MLLKLLQVYSKAPTKGPDHFGEGGRMCYIVVSRAFKSIQRLLFSSVDYVRLGWGGGMGRKGIQL